MIRSATAFLLLFVMGLTVMTQAQTAARYELSGVGIPGSTTSGVRSTCSITSGGYSQTYVNRSNGDHYNCQGSAGTTNGTWIKNGSAGGSGIGGSTGSVDGAIILASGTGGATVKAATGTSIDGSGNATVATLTTTGNGSGEGGGLKDSIEGTAFSGTASKDELYADSTAHRWKMNNNNAGAVQVVGSGVDINTSDQVTATHLALPLPASQGGFDPLDLTRLYVRDDFVAGNQASGTIGQLGWVSGSAGASATTTVVEGTYPRFGQIKVETDTTSGHDASMFLANSSGTLMKLGNLGGNTNWDSSWIVSLTAATSIRARIGFCYQATAGVVPTDGLWVGFDTTLADTNFTYEARAASTSTRTASSVAADTSFHRFRIRSTSAGTVLFSIDGGSETSIATNVPTQNLTPCGTVTTAAAATRGFTADFFAFLMTGLSR